MSPYEAFREAVRIAGGQTHFGRMIGVSQQRIWNWINDGKSLPADFVLAAEAATGVSRHKLRPDIYPLASVAE